MKNKAYAKLSAALIVLSLINLAVSLVFVMALPDKVPTHFTADMVCDGEGSKWNGLIFSVVIAVIMPLGLFMAKKTANVEKNSKPLFITRNVFDFGTSKVVGRHQEHIKLELVDSKSAVVMNGIAFGQSAAARYIKSRRSFDIVYTIEENAYKRGEIQLQIEGIQPSEGNDVEE